MRCGLPVQVYFSNRSAAYLKLGDAKSKALKDAERCMELAPEWSKSYSRLGAAQHALRRFDAAVQTFKVQQHSWVSNRFVVGLYVARSTPRQRLCRLLLIAFRPGVDSLSIFELFFLFPGHRECEEDFPP